MAKQYRHRRTSNPANAFPDPLEPGELAVNTANRQIAMGDADSLQVGKPLPVIAVRYFDTRASYAAADLVVQSGSIYRAIMAVPPGPFDLADWEEASGGSDFLPLAGGTLTGPLTLDADPVADLEAATKQYVDNATPVIPPPLYVSDTPPVSPPDNALWWESDSGTLYVRYNDGNTTQWVLAMPMSQPVDVSGFVKKTGDTMSGHLSLPTAPAAANAVRKDYVDAAITTYAAPLDAMAYNNIVINGGMEISQESGTAGTSTSSTYACDGWKLLNAGPSVFLGSVASGFPGYSRQLILSVTTGKPSLAATDVTMIYQFIEGQRISRLAWGTLSAKPITIGFWSYCSKPGVYSVVIGNGGANNRCYATTFTQAAANTSQYNVIVIPGDTTGTWANDNTSALQITFAVACGTTYIAPVANTWLAGSYVAAPGQINGVATTGDVFAITGVTILPGTHTITAAQSPLLMRPYGEELVLCQRYFQWVPFSCYFHAPQVGLGHASVVMFAATMRTIPTMGALTPDPSVTPVSANASDAYFEKVTASGARAMVVVAAAGAANIAGYRASADARL